MIKVLSLLILLYQCTTIVPLSPIVVSPNTQNSPGNFIFHFQLQYPLPTTSYILIVLPIFTTVTPTSCTLLSSSILVKNCVNLQSASSITINATAVTNVNPNINTPTTVVIGLTALLSASVPYSLQILTGILPLIGAISSSFEMYVMSGTGVMIEENWNAGHAYIASRIGNILQIVTLNDMTESLPATQVSNLLVQITIGVQCPTPTSRLIFTISSGFSFTSSSLVTITGVVGSPPQLLSTTLISANLIILVFNEQFSVGRQFNLGISNIQTPSYLSQGTISVYSLPYNSITPLEANQQAINIQTVSYSIPITIYTAQNLLPSAAVQFYTSTTQYIIIKIQLSRVMSSNFVLQITADTIQFQQGTIYAQTSTVTTNSLIYTHSSTSLFTISGFPTVASGSVISITARISISANPVFTISASIDQPSQISTPLMAGSAAVTASAVPVSMVSALTSTQTNKLTSMQTSTSSLSFTITPSFLTKAGSYLTIYTSPSLTASSSFTPAGSCLLNATLYPCSLTSNSTLSILTIASNTSYNIYPQSYPTSIVVNHLKFLCTTSPSSCLLHLYFQLTTQQNSTASSVKKQLLTPMVLPQRNQLPAFANYFTNDFTNAGLNFLNCIRLVSLSSASWQNVVQSYERRVISVFAYEGWTNLFTTLTSGSTYPCLTALTGTTFTYSRGTQINLLPQYPLAWDRIDIVLPGNQSINPFSINIPNTYTTPSATIEVLVGVININTKAITYLHSLSMPQPNSPTFRSLVAISVDSKPNNLLQLNISGNAGSYANTISLTVTPSPFFNGNGYSTAILIVSAWQFLDPSTTYASTTSLNPLYNNLQQKPLSIQISTNSYLTIIPFTTLASYTTAFQITFNALKLPYSLELPYYSVTLIDATGTIDSYNEFINQDQGLFYSGTLSSFSFTCNDNSLGVSNTQCAFSFTPFQDLDTSAYLNIALQGMLVSTNLCTFIQNNIPTPQQCTSTTDSTALTIKLSNSIRLPALQSYTLLVNGISITAAALVAYAQLSILDSTNSHVIEAATRILVTKVAQDIPIIINQVSYSKNNPIVSSALFVNFTLPRGLNPDQSLTLVLNSDFNLNNVPSRLKLLLYGSTLVACTWLYDSKNSRIIFQNLQGLLTAGEFSLQIYGIVTPSIITQSLITIIFIRTFDTSVAKTSTTTTIFPPLAAKVNSLITLSTYFNTEGFQHEISLTVQNQYAQITSTTVWNIVLPRYYSQSIWTDDYLRHCQINTQPLQCRTSTTTPYQIELSNSPLQINIGTTYTLTLYGIRCPRATYLNGNSLYVTQSIFLGVASSPTAPSYHDYSQVFISAQIKNPQTNYDLIVLTGVSSANMQTHQTTFFTLTMTTTLTILPGYWIYLTFPQAFDSFYSTSFTIQTQFATTTEAGTLSTTVNRRIAYQIQSITIPPNTPFTIVISSLVTPSTPQTIDMNQLLVFISTATRTTTLAASNQLQNLLPTLTFVQNTLYVSINHDYPITLTAGTYSLPIPITPSDNSTFITNMLVSFSAPNLAFLPNPNYLLLGTHTTSFTVGVNQNLIPTTYTFTMTKKQTSISSFYSAQNQYPVQINSIPIPIALPPTLTVPQGGCSLPTAITLTNPPFLDVTLTFLWNTSLWNTSLATFWVNEQLGYDSISFTTNTTTAWLSFCSTLTIPTLTVTTHLGGTNAAAYTLTNSLITVLLTANSTITPTLTITLANVQKTYASLTITTNTQGNLFYELHLAPLPTPLPLTTLKEYIKNNTYTLSSQTDHLLYIYAQDRDHRVGLRQGLNGSFQLPFDDLLPQRTYILCAYYESLLRTATLSQCVNWTMQTWGAANKAYITFTEPILANQLNTALCFFVRASNSNINQIITQDGDSCALATSPTNYNYAYKGASTTNKLNAVTLYHIPSTNLTTDSSISSFSTLFSNNTLTAAALSTAQSLFFINFIASGQSLPPAFSLINILTPTTASLTYQLQDYIKGSRQLHILNIKSSTPATLYAVLVAYKSIIRNQITGATTVSLRPFQTPTPEQIANCQDGWGVALKYCQRAVVDSSYTANLTFQSVFQDTVYLCFTIKANQYPLRPVFYGEVALHQWDTVNCAVQIYGFMVAVMLLIAL